MNQQWDRNVVHRMEKGGKKMRRSTATTEKVPVAPGHQKEVKINFQRIRKQLQAWHGIEENTITTFDETPLCYIRTPAYTRHQKGAKNVPLALMYHKEKMSLLTPNEWISYINTWLQSCICYDQL